jgi:phospholipase C
MSENVKPLGDDIHHIVVLMFENRSFDNVFGSLYPHKTQEEFDGLTGKEWNAVDPSAGNPERIYVWTDVDKGAGTMPYPDPGESFADMNEQILRPVSAAGGMAGFVANYIEQEPGIPYGNKPVAQDIMHYYGDSGLPVSRRLARQFAVSDRWFASGPTQTLPNRTFFLCGSPGVYEGRARVNNSDFRGWTSDPYGSVELKSICELLDESFPDGSAAQRATDAPLNWKVYYHEAPISTVVDYLYQLGEKGPNLTSYDYSDYGKDHWFKSNTVTPTFAEDVKADRLPKFAIIEPRYVGNYLAVNTQYPPNDNHPGGSLINYRNPSGNYLAPPVDVAYGEALLYDVFSTLQQNPGVFAKTLLIVTYDEHGGLYDHVAPGGAVSPYSPPLPNGFDYSRYGVRVPTFFVNPRIPPSTILRPQGDSQYPFDHTSIIRTVREQFPNGDTPLPPLTPRDRDAPAIRNLTTLGTPDNVLTDEELATMTPAPVDPGRPVGPVTKLVRRILLAAWRLAVRLHIVKYRFRFGLRL